MVGQLYILIAHRISNALIMLAEVMLKHLLQSSNMSTYPCMHLSSQVTLKFRKVSSQQTEVSLRHAHMSLFRSIVVMQNHPCCLTVSAAAHHMELHIVPHAALTGFYVVQMVSNFLHSSL